MSNQEQALEFRQTYQACIKLANETDSKKEDAYLKAEAKQALEQLRKVCPHELVVCLRSEYEGSYSMDYTDRLSEERICLCCGMEEFAYAGKWERLDVMPFARFEYRHHTTDKLTNPLNYLLLECKEDAETKGYSYHGSVRRLR